MLYAVHPTFMKSTIGFKINARMGFETRLVSAI
jgi:hypothetical protein